VSIDVISPVGGLAAPLSEVPDTVFSQAMLGTGVSVKPKQGRSSAYAPVAGTVLTMRPHAFVIATVEGPAVLVHLGINTVQLKGEGFTAHVAEGDVVVAGQQVVTWDPAGVEAQGFSSVCPVVVLETDAEALLDIRDDGQVVPGDVLFTVM
jgi:PTS system N-acetylglucosamine-specific IIA component